MELKIKNTTLKIIQGDITEQETDAITNAANTRLVMGGGVAGAIKKKGGKEIEDEAMKKGPISVGTAVITKAGKLKSKYVIHAAVMEMDFKTDKEKIKKATLSTLKISDEHNLSSVALPAFGTGVGGFPMDECAKIMLDTTLEYISKTETNIETILFVLYDKSGYEAFQKAMARLPHHYNKPKNITTET